MECFKVTIENQIAHVVLNRPDKRNSMNPAFLEGTAGPGSRYRR